MIFLGQEKPPLEDVLSHHGVKGMKWGVRKADTPTSKDHRNVKLSGSEAAPLIAVGVIYSAIVLAVAAKKAQDSGKFNQIKTKNVAWKKDASLTHKMSVDDLQKKVIKPINSDYGAKGTKMNCRRCTFAYEMRRRGYDVKATKSSFATGQDTLGLHLATSKHFKRQESVWGNKQIHFNDQSPSGRSEAIFKSLSKHPEGARGELGMAWQMGGGHSVAWEIVQGKPVIFDTQSSITYRSPKEFTKFASVIHDAAYTRLDNAPLNDAFMRKWAQNA